VNNPAAVRAVVLVVLTGIPNPDDFFQTRVSGLDALKPEFRVRVRVLQLWRVEDKRAMYTVCIGHVPVKELRENASSDPALYYAEERIIFCHHLIAHH